MVLALMVKHEVAERVVACVIVFFVVGIIQVDMTIVDAILLVVGQVAVVVHNYLIMLSTCQLPQLLGQMNYDSKSSHCHATNANLTSLATFASTTSP